MDMGNSTVLVPACLPPDLKRFQDLNSVCRVLAGEYVWARTGPARGPHASHRVAAASHLAPELISSHQSVAGSIGAGDDIGLRDEAPTPVPARRASLP